jgi:uncharacterized protein (DUF39 family)
MSNLRTYSEINQRISEGNVVVLTAEEATKMAKEQGVEHLAKEVDIVTTGTFGPMCSSGAFLNYGHSSPPINIKKAWLNDVPAYAGVAAVDNYIGATEASERDPAQYGGAHVIEDLVAGKDIKLRAIGKGTDCYPKKDIETLINKDTLNEAFLFNPRNAYQNYAVATNSSDKTIYTYMGILLPKFGNATYSTSGELSPLLNDPQFQTIGIGSKIFLGGTQGYVSWNGTQFNTKKEKGPTGAPIGPGATIAVVGNLKEMSTDFIRAGIYERYGISLFVGIGVPIPILTEDIARCVAVSDRELVTAVFDYSIPSRPVLSKVNYEQLKSGEIEIEGQKVKTGPLSSVYKARIIADELKGWIKKREFDLGQPVGSLAFESGMNPLKDREVA